MWILRKILHPMDELAAMEFLYDKLKSTKTNQGILRLDALEGLSGRHSLADGPQRRWIDGPKRPIRVFAAPGCS